MTHSDDTFDGLSEDERARDASPADDLGDTAVLNLRKLASFQVDTDRQSTGSIPAFLAGVAQTSADAQASGNASGDQGFLGIPDFLRHPEGTHDLEEVTAPAPAPVVEEEDELAGLDTFADEGTYIFDDPFEDALDEPYVADNASVEGAGSVDVREDAPADAATNDADVPFEESSGRDVSDYGDREDVAPAYDGSEAPEAPEASDAAESWRSSTLAWDTPIDALSATGEFGVYVSTSHEDEDEGASAPEPQNGESEARDPYPDRLLWPDEEAAESAAGDRDVDIDAPVVGGVRRQRDLNLPGADLADEPLDSEEPIERFEVLHGVPADESFDQYDASDEYDAYEGPVGSGMEGGWRREGEDAAVAGVYETAAKKKMSGVKRGLITAGVTILVIALIVGGYFIGLNHFKGRFLARTTINGLDVSGLTPTEAVSALEQETADYVCAVNVGDYAGAFTGRDYALERDEQKMADVAFSMVDVRLWPIRYLFGQKIVVDPALTFDEAQLRDYVMRSVDDYNAAALPTENAQIYLDEGTGLYSVEGTTSGTAVAKEPVADAVVASVREFKPESTPDAGACLHEATVQDLPTYAYPVVRTNLDRTNEIPVLVNGERVAALMPEQSREWVYINETPEIVVNTEALRDWATYVVADAVWHRDDWSNYSLDIDAFVAGLTERLKLGVVDGYEVPIFEELRTEGASRSLAYERGGWNSELGRYIDVDLEAQFVRLFDETGNVIWESACVSGDLYESRSTVTGVFEIYSKQIGVTLVGLDYNNDGYPDYESYVNYWMPFYGGYGLHDATWRANFGGDYFYYNGSHGCINLPYAKAEELYNITFVGEKVNVHW